jgi:hypothetical protein
LRPGTTPTTFFSPSWRGSGSKRPFGSSVRRCVASRALASDPAGRGPKRSTCSTSSRHARSSSKRSTRAALRAFSASVVAGSASSPLKSKSREAA